MARIELVDIADSDDPAVRDIHEYMAETGRNPDSEHWQLEANFPEIFRHRLRARASLWRDGDLERDVLEKLAVAVSAANGCTYCTGAFCTHLADMGYDVEEITAFLDAVGDHDVTDREQAILAFALQSLEAPDGVTDGLVETLKDDHGLTDRDLLQVVLVVNTISGFNRIVDTFDATYDHELPEELVGEHVELE